MIERVILIVLDSAGIGSLPDAARFDDDGANTILHTHRQTGGLKIPNLCRLGLGRVVEVGCSSGEIAGSYGRMAEKSAGKDTTTGHWELAGLVLEEAFPTYPDGFPPEIMDAFEEAIGRKIIGNYPRSGTMILDELGEEHLNTGRPIVYTSADSVFQVAAHEEVIPVETLYDYCRRARRLLTGRHAVGRVIARPFVGAPGRFRRDNAARKDFSLEPPGETLLDRLAQKGFFTTGIGKIGDLFGHRGLSEDIHTDNNDDGLAQTLETMEKSRGRKGLIFVNLVDFDTVYGHRRDPSGYASALAAFDRRLPEVVRAMSEGDVLIVTADHGCDPTYAAHTDHTREYVPLLVSGSRVVRNVNLGDRPTFADCGQTVADLLDAGHLACGSSFKKDIIHD